MGPTQVELDRAALRGPRAPEFLPLKIRSLLRPGVTPGEAWHWELNPYEGCGVGCTFCHARIERKDFESWKRFQTRIGVKTNAVEALLRDLREEDVRGRAVLLGTLTEPWQPAEEKFRLTRAVLEVLAELDGVDLRITTRSSLIARDTDLLSAIAARGRVTVAFSIAAHDEKVTRLLEPSAPSPLRRLSAMEALARAGLTVGLNVSPVFPGLDDDELGIEALLTRAANAGARFAGMKWVDFSAPQRENFLTQVTLAYPALAVRFRRVLGQRPPSDSERAELRARFETRCAQLGLAPLSEMTPPLKVAARPPAQLSLFQP